MTVKLPEIPKQSKKGWGNGSTPMVPSTMSVANRQHKSLWTPPKTNEWGVRVMDVGAELAGHLLQFNTRNRDLRQGHVETLARDMAAFRWRFTGDPVRFDLNGQMIDGQHRLTAILVAKVTLPTLIVWGLPEDAQDVIDTGMGRTMRDVLSLAGHQYSAQEAALLRQVHMWDAEAGLAAASGRGRGGKATHSELNEVHRANPDVSTAVQHVAINHQLRKVLGATPAAFCWLILNRIDSYGCEEFLDAIANGTGLVEGDARLVLRNQILSGYSTTKGRALIGWVFKAWNAWRKNTKVKQIKWTTAEAFPIPK